MLVDTDWGSRANRRRGTAGPVSELINYQFSPIEEAVSLDGNVGGHQPFPCAFSPSQLEGRLRVITCGLEVASCMYG